MGRAQTTRTAKEAGRANRPLDRTTELSAFASSSRGGCMLNHRLVWLYKIAERQAEVEAASRIMATASRTDALIREAIEEHGMTLVTEPPVILNRWVTQSLIRCETH